VEKKTIKKIKESFYNFKFSTAEGKTDGSFVKKIKSKTISEFNEKGNLIAYHKFTLTFSKIFPSTEIYIYDDYENKLEHQFYFNGDLNYKYTYTYNNGNLVEYNNYSSDGTLNKRGSFINNEEGKVVESLFFDRIRGWNRKNIFNYDENTYIDELKRNPLIDCLENKSTHKYDDRGNAIEIWVYDPDGNLSNIHVYKYDLVGNKIQYSIYAPDLEETYNSDFVYDADGNEISGSEREKKGDDRTWYKVYSKFDERRNWIEMKMFQNGVPTEFHLRRIEYY